MRSDDEPIRVLRVIARMNIGGPAWQTSVLTRKLPDYGIETRLDQTRRTLWHFETKIFPLSWSRVWEGLSVFLETSGLWCR